MRLASYVVLSATCRVTAVTHTLALTMVRMINRRGEQNEVVLEQYVPSFSLCSCTCTVLHVDLHVCACSTDVYVDPSHQHSCMHRT